MRENDCMFLTTKQKPENFKTINKKDNKLKQ